VTAFLDQPAMVQYQDAIDSLHGGEPVGDDYGASLPEQPVQRLTRLGGRRRRVKGVPNVEKDGDDLIVRY